MSITPDFNAPLKERLEILHEDMLSINEEYNLPKPIQECYTIQPNFHPKAVEGLATIVWLKGNGLTREMKDVCVTLFHRHFPYPVGKESLLEHPAGESDL